MKIPLILIAMASLPLLLTSCYTDGYPYGGGGYGGGSGGGYGGGHVYHRGHHYDGRSNHRSDHYDHRRVYRSGHRNATPYTSHSDSHRADHRTTRHYSDSAPRENQRSRVSIGGWTPSRDHQGESTHGRAGSGHRTDSGRQVNKHSDEKDQEKIRR